MAASCCSICAASLWVVDHVIRPESGFDSLLSSDLPVLSLLCWPQRSFWLRPARPRPRHSLADVAGAPAASIGGFQRRCSDGMPASGQQRSGGVVPPEPVDRARVPGRSRRWRFRSGHRPGAARSAAPSAAQARWGVRTAHRRGSGGSGTVQRGASRCSTAVWRTRRSEWSCHFLRGVWPAALSRRRRRGSAVPTNRIADLFKRLRDPAEPDL